MECENLYCIYQESGFCLLKKISLDKVGQCTQCILVEIDDLQINNLKKSQRDF